MTLNICGIAADPQMVWLDELDVTLSTCGWGSTRKNMSVGGNKLTMAGKTYEHGIGTHAPGEFQIKLEGGTRRFTALVGIDAESGNAGSAEFQIMGDKKVLWKSGVMRGGASPKAVDVDLSGVKLLRLIVTTGGDSYAHDHTDWVDARFEVTGKRPSAVKSAGPPGPTPEVRGPDAVAGPQPELLRTDWEEQYAELANIKADAYRFPAEQVLNTQSLKQASDASPLDVGLRRSEALIAKLKNMSVKSGLNEAEDVLKEIKDVKVENEEAKLALYLKLRKSMRKATLSNPLLDFDSLLFVSRGVLNDASKRKSEYDGDHFCDQYYGHNGRRGGGLFILKNWKSPQAEVIDIVKGLKVPTGTNKDMPMSDGTFLSPDLSWDGKTVVFAWSSGGTTKWDPATRFSIFKVGIDGSNLTRLTDDSVFDDFDPIFLPNGRIVFMSTRRHGFGRCHGRPVPAFTMFSIKADGSDMIPIDFHETNEFHPSVDNRGMLVYTRWDYVDRDHSSAHHMWHCYPDGRDPRAFHGNYSLPLTTVEGEKWPRGINMRPWAEFNCRSIPGSDKYIATAGPHHGQAFGSLVMIDINIPDDNKMSQVRRITPDVLFPESETGVRHWSSMAYGTAWPLSESFYLCNYKDSIRVLDEFGNRELVCKVTNGLRPLDPIPLRARQKPPVIPTGTCQGENLKPDSPVATISVMNVYETDEFGKLPEGAEIKQMRIVQVLPKSSPRSNNPRIGYGNQSLGRIPLGVVPVEKDGSVYFKAPVGKAIYFQLLDETGMAVQSMRSVTYVHPGEQMSCVGCHESKWDAVRSTARPTALRRSPSELEPEIKDLKLFSFHRHVRPVFEKKCVGCHTEKKEAMAKATAEDKKKESTGPTDMAYQRLEPYMFYLGHGQYNRLHGGTRIKPGKFGAMFSRMGKALLNENHQKSLKEGKFTEEEMRAVIMWLDMNSNELVAYKDVEAQKQGEIVWPEFDVDPQNISGVERRGGTKSVGADSSPRGNEVTKLDGRF